MIKKLAKIAIFILSTIFFILDLDYINLIQASPNEFAPVPFENIPMVILKSDNSEYELGADFSIDYGGEKVINNDNNSKSAGNVSLVRNLNGLSLGLECKSGDECGTSLSPRDVSVYLVDKGLSDKEIVENSVPILELEDNDCGDQSIAVCANFNFTIPSDILIQEYKIVVDMSFDEAQWIIINPVRISD